MRGEPITGGPVNGAFGLIGHAGVLPELRAFRGHALLLSGPARVGKRPLAGAIAALYNCARFELAGGDGAPCGACASCLAARRGDHPDLLALEPSSLTASGKQARRKIIPVAAIAARRDEGHDFERHVLEWLEVAPTYRRKTVLIDGAEFLNAESANALLKVVEAPPHGALFLFLAEDVGAVLPTIASRAARLSVPPVAAGALDAALHLLGEQDAALLAFAAGRPGVVVERARAREALADAEGFVTALGASMFAALEAAEALEKRFDPAWHPEALRFALRAEEVAARAHADAALERALSALEQYVSPSLTFQLLSLEWRAALGRA